MTNSSKGSEAGADLCIWCPEKSTHPRLGLCDGCYADYRYFVKVDPIALLKINERRLVTAQKALDYLAGKLPDVNRNRLKLAAERRERSRLRKREYAKEQAEKAKRARAVAAELRREQKRKALTRKLRDQAKESRWLLGLR